MQFLSNASRLLHQILYTDLKRFCPRFYGFSIVSLYIQRISTSCTTSKLKLEFCYWTTFDSIKQMLNQLIVQSVVANINRVTLAIKQFRLLIKCSKCAPLAITHAFRRLRKPTIALRIVSSGSLSHIVCKTIISSELFCCFQLNLLNSSSIVPHTQ